MRNHRQSFFLLSLIMTSLIIKTRLDQLKAGPSGLKGGSQEIVKSLKDQKVQEKNLHQIIDAKQQQI